MPLDTTLLLEFNHQVLSIHSIYIFNVVLGHGSLTEAGIRFRSRCPSHRHTSLRTSFPGTSLSLGSTIVSVRCAQQLFCAHRAGTPTLLLCRTGGFRNFVSRIPNNLPTLWHHLFSNVIAETLLGTDTANAVLGYATQSHSLLSVLCFVGCDSRLVPFLPSSLTRGPSPRCFFYLMNTNSDRSTSRIRNETFFSPPKPSVATYLRQLSPRSIVEHRSK